MDTVLFILYGSVGVDTLQPKYICTMSSSCASYVFEQQVFGRTDTMKKMTMCVCVQHSDIFPRLEHERIQLNADRAGPSQKREYEVRIFPVAIVVPPWLRQRWFIGTSVFSHVDCG